MPIEKPHSYRGLELSERPVIVKLHGSIDRDDPLNGSYVLTEETYIRYLTGPSLNTLIPASLMTRIRKSHLLFLGYAMRDWNIRAMLEDRQLQLQSWAVQLEPPSEAARAITKTIWEGLGVDVLNVPLRKYISRLEAELAATNV